MDLSCVVGDMTVPSPSLAIFTTKQQSAPNQDNRPGVLQTVKLLAAGGLDVETALGPVTRAPQWTPRLLM